MSLTQHECDIEDCFFKLSKKNIYNVFYIPKTIVRIDFPVAPQHDFITHTKQNNREPCNIVTTSHTF